MTKAYHKDQSLPIGLFDSGVGGLSLLQALKRELPRENYIYLADTQYAPYGPQTVEFISQRVMAMADFLAQRPVKAILVACNTATAAAVKALRNKYPIPIIGLEPALKPAVEHCNNKPLGVLATEATLESEKYKRLKQSVAKDISLVEKGSKRLVELVEKGNYQDPKAQLLIESELTIFKAKQIDTLVLGCSHFPFLKKEIQDFLGDKVELFESGQPVAREVARQIDDCLNPQENSGFVEYYSSQPDKSQKVFEQILNQRIQLKQLEI